jgi:hypothetical protein
VPEIGREDAIFIKEARENLTEKVTLEGRSEQD